jgi:hypothetical protein
MNPVDRPERVSSGMQRRAPQQFVVDLNAVSSQERGDVLPARWNALDHSTPELHIFYAEEARRLAWVRFTVGRNLVELADQLRRHGERTRVDTHLLHDLGDAIVDAPGVGDEPLSLRG